MSSLVASRCIACEGGDVKPLDSTAIKNLTPQLSNQWQVKNDLELFRDFKFKNYYQTMAFVNAVAWMANMENHHPDLEVGFNHCLVRYTTHAVKGLTQNDFICAAKVDQLFSAYEEKMKP